MRNEETFNASGCKDLTAYIAIKNIETESKSKKRLKSLMREIFTACDAYGFHLEERVVLKDKKTGKIWR